MRAGREAADAQRERATDVAEADDADRVAGDAAHRLVVLQRDAAILAPGAVARGADGVVEATRQRQQHRHRVVGHLGGVGAGHVAGEDAEPRRGVEIDRVDADAHAAHHLELGALFEHALRGERQDADLRSVGVFQQLDQLVLGAADALHHLEAGGFEEVHSVVGAGLQCHFHG